MRLWAALLITLTILLNSCSVTNEMYKASRADIALKNQKYKKAARLYSKILRNTATITLYHSLYQRGLCYYHLKEHEEAKADFQNAVQIPSEHWDYNGIRGNSLWMLARLSSQANKPLRALDLYTQATKHVQDSKLYSTIAYKQCQLKMLDEALENSNRAIELDSTNAYAYSNRSLVFLHRLELEKGMANVNKSIELDPSNPYAFKHKAMILIAMKDIEMACQQLDKAEELGYADFDNEIDANDVADLKALHCQ